VKGPTLVPGLPSIQACLIARQVVRARYDHKWVAVGDEKSLPPPSPSAILAWDSFDGNNT
jgi:hypothetical protein